MHSGLVFALITLPAVAFSQQITGQEYKLFSCTVTKYAGVAYTRDNLLGPNRGWPVKSFEECIEKCLLYANCVAINILSGKICQPLKTGIEKADRVTYKKDYLSGTNSDHGFISCPDPKPPTATVGCGKQADAYAQNLFKTTRIIGGDTAKPHSWPWQVFFQYVKQSGNTISTSNCGASLIRVKDDKEESDILVTAAHCITDEVRGKAVLKDYKLLQAIAGEHDRDKYDDGQQFRKVAAILPHPEYDTAATRNDIAIVKLVKPIVFTDTIRPICLPKQDEDMPVGKKCAATGWGRINSKTGETSKVLKQLSVEAQTADTCIRNVNGGWGRMFQEKLMVCAGSLQGKESTCQGDSGGPLACEADGKWTLYGAVSFGRDESCLSPGTPTVFARVSNYVDWITKNAAKLTDV